MSIIAVLLAVLLPSLGYAMGASRGLKCQMAQRSIAFDFTIFADDMLHPYRGEDSGLPPNQFSLTNFIESEYGVDEFWAHGPQETVVQPKHPAAEMLRCPDVAGDVLLTRGVACGQGAITPAEHVAFGFNMRLQKAEVRTPYGTFNLRSVSLSKQILRDGRIPLAWDVDGTQAKQRGLTPHFTAPPVADSGPYAGGARWFPRKSHNGRMNVALTDGSVEATPEPLAEDWRWDYQPRP